MLSTTVDIGAKSSKTIPASEMLLWYLFERLAVVETFCFESFQYPVRLRNI